jgi:parallel beta-helix repeat protein
MSSNELNFDSEGENDIDSSNQVEGKVIYYLVSAYNQTIEPPMPEAGMIYCLNCSNVTIRNQSIDRSSWGVFFDDTSYSSIENCTFANNSADIILRGSGFNAIRKNNIISDPGLSRKGSIILDKSHENTVAGNNIRNSTLGLSLFKSLRNNISNNRIVCIDNAATIQESGENIIQGNSFNSSRNENGILLKKSYSNVIQNNNLQGS